MPLLTQIAHLYWIQSEEFASHSLRDILICHFFQEDRIVFRVVDYRTNYLTCFSVDVDAKCDKDRLDSS